MAREDLPNLIYLVVLLVGVASFYLASQRGYMGRVGKYAAIWAVIFAVAIAGAYMWTQITQPRQMMLDTGAIQVPRDADGHFYLTLQVNGAPTRFVVDTGASAIVLTQADALSAGIATEELIFSGRAITANGQVETAPIRIDTLRLGELEDANVRAVVNAGEMRESLLGMSYLNRFSRIEIADGVLVLER